MHAARGQANWIVKWASDSTGKIAFIYFTLIYLDEKIKKFDWNNRIS